MSKRKNNLVQPFLKWAGGKRQALKDIRKYVPKKFVKYYEPFLGGGAVLFDLMPQNAIVNDSNAELINVYQVVRTDVEALIKELKKYKNEKEEFYRIRELDRTTAYKKLSDVQRAARIIYLNKTCYNGLFRVNSQGQFNVPFGSYKNPDIINEITLRAVNNYFNENKIELLNVDFAESLDNIKKGSFVYFDPPYDPVSDTSSFTGYTFNGFDQNEQTRLKETCDYLDKQGCCFLLSNSATSFIKELYKNYQIEIVEVGRNINSDGTKRGKIEEVLIRNY